MRCSRVEMENGWITPTVMPVGPKMEEKRAAVNKTEKNHVEKKIGNTKWCK